MRRFRAVVLTVVVVVAAIPPHAMAASDSAAPDVAAPVPVLDFSGGTLTIELLGSSDADLGCSGGFVQINGAVPGGAPACADVEVIEIRGSSRGNDISTAAVNFFNYTQLPPIRILAGGGADSISLGLLKERVVGGAGSDGIEVFPIGPGAMTLTDGAWKVPGTKDTLSGLEWANITLPNGGNTVDASAFSGSVVITGGTGADELTGTRLGDILVGGDGADVLRGGAGADAFEPGQGDDAILGGTNLDSVTIDDLDAMISITDAGMTSADTGADTMSSVESFAATADPAAGNVVSAFAFSGSGSYVGGSGNDTISGPSGGMVFMPGNGNDVFTGNATPGPGNPGDMFLIGLSGAGTVGDGSANTNQGNDVFGGIDLMIVFGSAGADSLDASARTQGVYAFLGIGADVMVGGSGDDVFEVGDGDAVDGNGGADLISNYTYYQDQVLTDAAYTGTGLTAALAEVERADLTAAIGSSINAAGFSGSATLHGNTGAERLIGGPARDVLLGDDGNDVLKGSGGNDRLEGGNGNDSLTGGAGRDICKGGAGRDRFKTCERALAAPTWTDPHAVLEQVLEVRSVTAEFFRRA